MTKLSHSYPFDPTYGYDLESLLRVRPPDEPWDLAEFWENTYRQAREIPLNAVCRAVPCERPDYDLFEVDYDS